MPLCTGRGGMEAGVPDGFHHWVWDCTSQAQVHTLDTSADAPQVGVGRMWRAGDNVGLASNLTTANRQRFW